MGEGPLVNGRTYSESETSSDFTFEIPHLFDHEKFQKGGAHKVRITHIYDLSKFWITTKYRELECFQKYLFKKYYNHHEEFQLPEENIEIGQYCVVFEDQAYYRGIIIGFVQNHKTRNSIQFLNIDFGLISCTSLENLFTMNEIVKKVPRFAIRASLYGVYPSSDTNNWTVKDYTRFLEICSRNVLTMKIFLIDNENKTLNIRLWKDCEAISNILYSEKLLKYIDDLSENEINNINYTFLQPSHEMIETGRVPCTISNAEYLNSLQTTLSSKLDRNYLF